MASIEERLTALEHEHAELKGKIELQTIAIGALANFEVQNEKLDQIILLLNTLTNKPDQEQ